MTPDPHPIDRTRPPLPGVPKDVAFPDYLEHVLPNGLKVEAGCLVGPGASMAELRRQKVVRRGQSVPEDHA